MAEQLDWAIWGRDASVKTVLPDDTLFGYDLYNLTTSDAIVYGSRQGDNINLVWGDPGKSDNIRFSNKSGKKAPITYDELIAINVRGGKFLVYEKGRQGINLGWSDTPRYEWKIVGGKTGEAIPTLTRVGLFSEVEKDVLMYEPRDWGINLKWYKDSGKYRDISNAISAGKKVAEVGKAIGSLFAA
jgi:hypothetical protein